MSDNRQQLLDWVNSGHLDANQLQQAFSVTQSAPNPADNLRFLSRVVLAFAVLLLCSGVIFFFAYNWDDLSRYGKFAIAQVALILSLLPLLRVNPQQPSGQAALFGACLLVGALLAVVGQTYQSGADTYQLFLIWAVLITPWVVLARLPALWLLLLVLLNLSVALAISNLSIRHLFVPFGNPGWALFALNASAAGLWIFATQHLVPTRLLDWAQQAIGLYCLLIITLLAINFISSPHNRDVLTVPLWGLFSWLWLYMYRLRQLNVVMLSALVMATTALVVSLVAQALSGMIRYDLLFFSLALIIMGLSSAGAVWLKQLSAHASTVKKPTPQDVDHD